VRSDPVCCQLRLADRVFRKLERFRRFLDKLVGDFLGTIAPTS
jgi:hypothetical protein